MSSAQASELRELYQEFDHALHVLAKILVAAGAAESGQSYTLDEMESIVDSYTLRVARIVSEPASETLTKDRALADLLGAVLPLRVGNRSVAFLDSRLYNACIRARKALRL